MPKYTFKSRVSGHDSEYESDGGTKYSPKKELGEGGYSTARLFQSDNKRKKAVLAPKNLQIDFQEAQTKAQFFKALYPSQDTQLIIKSDDNLKEVDYRLVLPLISGKSYEELFITEREEQIGLFLSAIKALQHCHERDYIVVDLKEDNIHYDESTGQSYLIDGGLAVKTGHPMTYLLQTDDNQITLFRERFPFYAPECFKKDSLATPMVDVYSLGNMMSLIFANTGDDLNQLFQACQSEVPEERPTLAELETTLLDLLQKTKQANQIVSQLAKAIQTTPVYFSDKNTNKEIKSHRNYLITHIEQLAETNNALKEACQLLGLKKLAPAVQLAFDMKCQQIEDYAQLRINRLDSINRLLTPMNNALVELEKKLDELDPFQNDKMYETAKKLLDSLRISQTKYSNFLYSCDSEDENACRTFKQECFDATDAAKLILEKDSDWCSYLNDLANVLVNQSSVARMSYYTGNFFKLPPEQSKAVLDITNAFLLSEKRTSQ